MKFLTLFLGVLDKLLGAWAEHRWKRQGRQETIKEMNEVINEQIALGEAVIVTPDPERDERLRNRFDRSRTSK